MAVKVQQRDFLPFQWWKLPASYNLNLHSILNHTTFLQDGEKWIKGTSQLLYYLSWLPVPLPLPKNVRVMKYRCRKRDICHLLIDSPNAYNSQGLVTDGKRNSIQISHTGDRAQLPESSPTVYLSKKQESEAELVHEPRPSNRRCGYYKHQLHWLYHKVHHHSGVFCLLDDQVPCGSLSSLHHTPSTL